MACGFDRAGFSIQLYRPAHEPANHLAAGVNRFQTGEARVWQEMSPTPKGWTRVLAS